MIQSMWYIYLSRHVPDAICRVTGIENKRSSLFLLFDSSLVFFLLTNLPNISPFHTIFLLMSSNSLFMSETKMNSLDIVKSDEFLNS